jgi:cytosine deaminase
MMRSGPLPPGPWRFVNATVPACLIGRPGDLVRHAFGQGTEVDLKGRMVLPAFIDMHTHLDKGHIWPRAPNPDGTFTGALTTVHTDRTARWRAQDVRARMEFSLRAAWVHGTQAIRTHLDAIPPQDAISFAVFREVRADWKGRIDLQAVCLVGADGVSADGPFRATADMVAAAGGVLGMVPYPMPDIRDRMRLILRMAADRGLPVDLHVDETMDPAVNCLRIVAEEVIATGFSAPVTVGHCCSVSAMAEGEALATLDLVARAGLHVVSLPMCNLYLQDRAAGRTPRRRGVTLVHEMAARGINVSFASDNTRDPFYAYGDMDMAEVLREATRIGHLDHSRPDWVQAVFANPARACGFAAPVYGDDLVIFRGRDWSEVLSRPEADRIVIRQGRVIDRTPPDYAELDPLMDRP